MRKYKNIILTVLVLAVLAGGAITSFGASGKGAAGSRNAMENAGPGVVEQEASEPGGPEPGASEPEALESEKAEGEKGQPVVDGVIQPQNLEGAAAADQLIVVVGSGGCNGDAYYYRKKESSWELVWKEAAIVGRNGISPDKREGDGKTPAGVFGFTMSFGLKEDPGSVLPYHKIVKGDYWVDDPASPYYNKLVNTTRIPKDWNSAENMSGASPYYNYALALDFNPGCVPGNGSAIFLHCLTASADNGSAGCIRLPEARVTELVQSAGGQTNIIIAPDINQLK